MNSDINSPLRDLPPPATGKCGWPWTEGAPSLPTSMPDGAPWPRISIVTPSFNQEQFIEETIRSVLLQGYPNLEYLVIDGGSTDGSCEVIQKYSKWITFWVSEPDRGQSHAINKGFTRSTGEIMAWLNSDDIYYRGALSVMVKKLLTPNPAWAIGAAEVVTKSGHLKLLREPREITIDTFVVFLQDWFPQQATFWNRAMWNLTGFVDEELHYTMDLDLWYRMFQIARPSITNTLIAKYRSHPKAKTFRDSEHFEKLIAELGTWLLQKIITDNNVDIEEAVARQLIRLQQRSNYLDRILNHPAIGRFIRFWIRYVNSDLVEKTIVFPSVKSR